MKNQIREFEKNKIIEDQKLRKAILDYKNGKNITNEFLKKIIDRIEIYSDLRVEIIFKI